jgi:hypothetical protein
VSKPESDQTQEALDRGSVCGRIEDTIRWARGRKCRPCRLGEQGCPACVKAQEACDLLAEILLIFTRSQERSSPGVQDYGS